MYIHTLYACDKLISQSKYKFSPSGLNPDFPALDDFSCNLSPFLTSQFSYVCIEMRRTSNNDTYVGK